MCGSGSIWGLKSRLGCCEDGGRWCDWVRTAAQQTGVSSSGGGSEKERSPVARSCNGKT